MSDNFVVLVNFCPLRSTASKIVVAELANCVTESIRIALFPLDGPAVTLIFESSDELDVFA